MKLPSRLLWVDLETTGLDPDKDQVLEVAAVVTDNRLNEVAFVNVIVTPKGLVLNEFVLKMHVKNGLLADLVHGRPIAEIDALLAGFAYAHQAAGGPMCGASPQGVDLPFVSKHLPTFRRCFNHRVLDTSTLELGNLIEASIAESNENRDAASHRALADTRYAIAHARNLLGLE